MKNASSAQLIHLGAVRRARRGLLGESVRRPRSNGPDRRQSADWMRRIADHGDRGAFECVFNAYAGKIKGYLMRSGAAEHQAEEAMQETMAAVWRKAALYDPSKANLSAWIFTIARNQRIDALRRENRPAPDPSDPAMTPDAPAAPDQQMHAEDMAARLRAAVAALPHDQQAAIRLSFFEDQPHSAIAQELGVPLGTVKSRIRLAFGRLREAMRSAQEAGE